MFSQVIITCINNKNIGYQFRGLFRVFRICKIIDRKNKDPQRKILAKLNTHIEIKNSNHRENYQLVMATAYTRYASTIELANWFYWKSPFYIISK